MKSLVVYKDGTYGFEDLPMPKIGEYDALVKVLSCGVCNGTDMKIIHGNFKGIEDYPVVLGHEGIGQVVELGAKVKNMKKGDIVMMPYYSDVPEGYTSGWGTYSEYATVSDAKAMQDDGKIPDEFAWGQTVLPEGTDPISAAMIITFREVRSTMDTFGFSANKSLAVLGLGPVGLSFVRFAKLIGMGPIIAMDIQPEKLELAKKMGADYVINTKEQDLVKAVKEICPEGVDFALDAVGINPFINQALNIIKPDAKVCVYGISPKTTQEIDWSVCPYNWTLQFSQFPIKAMEAAAQSQIVSWIQAGALDPNDFISHVFDFDDIGKAFELIERREPCMKMVIRF